MPGVRRVRNPYPSRAGAETRTPYNNNEDRFVDPCIFFAQHGYVAVTQDLRGRFDSEGQFYPWVNDYNDGYDTIEWAAKLEWSDGRVLAIVTRVINISTKRHAVAP